MPENFARLPVTGMVPQLKSLAQQIKEADPSLANVDDMVLEAAWKQKYGDKTPADLEAPPQTQQQPGLMDRFMQGMSNPANMPTVKGAAGGLAGALVGGPMGAVAGAALGGAFGDVNEQQRGDSVMEDSYDPLQTVFESGKQGLFEGLGQLFGYAPKRVGAVTYTSGAGLGKANFSQNFPTAAQEGLEGGLFGQPIFTASGARRAYERAAPVPSEMISRADDAAGGPTLTMAEPLRRGGRPVLDEIGRGTPNQIGGSAQPPVERAAVLSELRDIMKAHSSAPQQIPYQTNSGHFGMQTVPGRPHQYTGTALNEKKQGLQTRAMDAMKTTNADKFPGQAGRTARGAAIGVQKTLEDYVQRLTGEDLAGANRTVQGLTGLNQSMNPSFRTPDELIKMGVDPTVAAVMTTNQASNWWPRIMGDVAMGAGAFGSTGSLPLSAGAFAAAHAASSPLGRRVLGGSTYTAGRMAPGAIRAGRAGYELTDDEVEALRRAIGGR